MVMHSDLPYRQLLKNVWRLFLSRSNLPRLFSMTAGFFFFSFSGPNFSMARRRKKCFLFAPAKFVGKGGNFQNIFFFLSVLTSSYILAAPLFPFLYPTRPDEERSRLAQRRFLPISPSLN